MAPRSDLLACRAQDFESIGCSTIPSGDGKTFILDPQVKIEPEPFDMDYDVIMREPSWSIQDLFFIARGMPYNSHGFRELIFTQHPCYQKLLSAFHDKTISATFKPLDFVIWALDVDYPISDAFRNAAARFERARKERLQAFAHDLAPRTIVDARRWKSVQIVLGSIALKDLGYDPQ